MYDIFAARYGHSVKDFYSLTEKQIAALIPAIQDAHKRDLKQQAALLGKKIKESPSFSEMLNNEVSPEAQKDLEDAASSVYNRLKISHIQKKLDEDKK